MEAEAVEDVPTGNNVTLTCSSEFSFGMSTATTSINISFIGVTLLGFKSEIISFWESVTQVSISFINSRVTKAQLSFDGFVTVRSSAVDIVLLNVTVSELSCVMCQGGFLSAIGVASRPTVFILNSTFSVIDAGAGGTFSFPMASSKHAN